MPEKPAQERTERPTARRRNKAIDEGRVARSQDVNSTAILLGGLFVLSFAALKTLRGFTEFLQYVYCNLFRLDITVSSVPDQVEGFLEYIVVNFGFFFFAIFLVAIVANLAQDRFQIHFMKKALQPKFSSLNPIEGFKKLISLNSFVELIKGIFKLLIVGLIAYTILKKHLLSNHFWLLHNVTVAELLKFFGRVCLELGAKLGVVLFIFALLDFAYQKWRYEKSLKMTKQEVKDERKQHEGNPEIKSKIRAVQRAISRKRMMAAVPDATVVVTNPVFIAVAIKYKPKKKTDAPIVVAKGKRKIAQRIKTIARQHEVPIIENRPLARSLYDTTPIGMEIPIVFYQTVAEILARIFQRKQGTNPLGVGVGNA